MNGLDEKAKNMPQYAELMSKMLEEDKARMEFSKVAVKDLSAIGRYCYSSMKWPVKLVHPMFEARAAFAVPNNYFQNLFLGEERLGNSFAHGAMRSVFFSGERLILFSKSVNFKQGREFFTTFILLHLEKNEYKHTIGADGIAISANIEKPMKNLITGKVENKKIIFNFVHKPVQGRMVSKEHAAGSSRFKGVYEKYGGADMKAASMDMEGYAVTVPHFSPHPYLLQLHKEFGFENNKEFQLHVKDYFEEHLG